MSQQASDPTFEFDIDLAKTAVKTALSAMICYHISRIANAPSGVWSVVTAILVTQSNLGGTVKFAWIRAVSTLIGALFGWLTIVAFGLHSWSLGIGVLLTLLLCAWARPLREVSRMAAVTASLFFGVRFPNLTMEQLALFMFGQIGLGIVVGLSVASLLWPTRASRIAVDAVADLLDGVADFYQAVIEQHLAGKVNQQQIDLLIPRLRATYRRCETLLAEGRNEPGGRDAYDDVNRILQGAVLLFRYVLSMERETRRVLPPVSPDPMQPLMLRLADETIAAIRDVARATRSCGEVTAFPKLAEALQAADARVDEVRRSGVRSTWSLQKILQSWAIYLGMRTIADDLSTLFGSEGTTPFCPPASEQAVAAPMASNVVSSDGEQR